MNELSPKLRSLCSAAPSAAAAWLFVSCLLLGACSSNSDGGPQHSGGGASAAGTGNASAGSNSAGTGNASGGSNSAGTGNGLPGGGSNASGGSNGASGAPSSGAGGGTSQGGVGSAGQGGAAPVSNVSLTPHAVALSAGKAFNVAEDFFDDGFIPASPLANFGFQTPIIPVVRADGALDVAWLDYTNVKGKPFALPSPGMIYITHIDPALGTGTTVATGITSYRLLGFTSDPSGAFYLAYCADHPQKNATDGDYNAVNGNELKIAKSTSADFTTKAWDKLVFGDQDNNTVGSKGEPGAGGSGVLGFDLVNQKLVLYIAHQMTWADDTTANKIQRHQAGYFGYFDPSTGEQAKAGGSNTAQTGAGWFYSHNFNQRLLIDNGVSYTLAHGDAYDRQLGFSAWTLDSYTKKNNTTFDQSYLKIAGAEGNNKTDTETGQFIKLADGRFVIVHTTAQDRTARDVRIVLANGTTGATLSEAWLTTNTGNIQAMMPKLELLGDKLLVTYGLWDSTQRTNKKIDWSSQLVDLTLKPVGSRQSCDRHRVRAKLAHVPLPRGPERGQRGLGVGERDAHAERQRGQLGALK